MESSRSSTGIQRRNRPASDPTLQTSRMSRSSLSTQGSDLKRIPKTTIEELKKLALEKKIPELPSDIILNVIPTKFETPRDVQTLNNYLEVWISSKNHKKYKEVKESLFINTTIDKLNNLLLNAAEFGCCYVIDALLDKGADVNTRKNNNGYTPLLILTKTAAQNRNILCMKRLLSHPEIDINAVSIYGDVALSNAASSGYVEYLDLLLKRPEINVNYRAIAVNATALYYAAYYGHASCVHRLLQDTRIDPSIKGLMDHTPLFAAAIKGHTECLRLLLKVPNIKINEKDRYTDSVLYLTSKNGNEECVRLLLTVPNININIEEYNFKQTPLHIAADKGHIGCVKALLSTPGINVNAENKYGMTPLYRAVQNNRIACVKDLLAFPGINVNAADADGDTILHIAADKGNVECVKDLLAFPGINVNAKDTNGCTPLHFAAGNGYVACVKELLAYPKININIKTNGEDGMTPLEIVEFVLSSNSNDPKEEHKEILGLIKKHKEQSQSGKPTELQTNYIREARLRTLAKSGPSIPGPSTISKGGATHIIYKGRKYKIYIGKKGGKYICVGVDKKKIYV